VVVVNVLSEAFREESYVEGSLDLVRQLLKRKVKRSGFLVIVEPALKRFARKMAEIGAAFQAGGGCLAAPCLAAAGCPYLLRKDRFCFHAISVPLSPLLQSVSARSELDRHEVNYSYLTFSPEDFEQELPECGEGTMAGRIVSFPKRVKKGFNYFVCTGEGVIQGFAPRVLPDGNSKGGKLKHGTMVVVGKGGR